MSIMKRQKDQFARLFMERLRRGGETRLIKYDRKKYRLLIDGGTGVCNLGNLFHYYDSRTGDAREDFLRTQTRNWFVTQKGTPTDFEDAMADLLPRLESRTELEFDNLEGRFGERRYQVIGEHLGLALVYDWPDAVRWIGQHDLQTWGVTFENAIEIAWQNLVTLGPPVLASPRPGLYTTCTGDNYDATRFMRVDLIKQLPVRGATIAIPANRDTLIITGADDEDGLAAMAELAAKAIKEPYSIAPLPLRLNADRWIPWLPSPDHSQYAAFKTLELGYLGNAYERQRRLLGQAYSKGEQECAVPAAFWLASNTDTGQPFSMSMLTEIVPMSCPKTDVVAICRAPTASTTPEECCTVSWDDALAILGNATQPLDIYPKRYLITKFPADTAWQRLKEAEREFFANSVIAQHSQVKSNHTDAGEPENRGRG